MDFRQQVRDWISRAEDRLSDQLVKDEEWKGSKSTKSSRTSRSSQQSKSCASSSASSRTRERVKLAELLAEKAMLKRKQALKAAEEDLQLDTEIAKAQAREGVYQEMVQVVDTESTNVKEKDVNPHASNAQDEERPRPPTTPIMTPIKPVVKPLRTLSTTELSVYTLSDFGSAPGSPVNQSTTLDYTPWCQNSMIVSPRQIKAIQDLNPQREIFDPSLSNSSTIRKVFTTTGNDTATAN